VNGDLLVEPNETFFVNLSNSGNATIGDTQGRGTINNDVGTITNSGSIVNSGQIHSDGGTINNNSPGTITIQGTGAISQNLGGTINNNVGATINIG